MYVSFAVYILLIGLLVWGSKWGGKSSYNDDFMSREATLSVHGIAALGVLLHHISQEQVFQDAKCLAIFNGIGYLFVAMFFFCSGYGLIKSLSTKSGYLDTFMQKRLPAVIVPFYVNTLIFALARYLRGDKMSAAQWIISFTGLSLMSRFAWYAVVIVILYAVFYVAFRRIKNHTAAIMAVTAAVLLQGAAFCFIGHFAWWAGEPNWWLTPGAWQNAPWWKGTMITWFHGEWWVNSSIAFPLGLLFAEYEEKVMRFVKPRYWRLLIVSIAAAAAALMLSRYAQRNISYWSEFSGNGPGIRNKAICYLVQLVEVPAFINALFMLRMKWCTINPATLLFGNLSLETYLMQPIAIMLLTPMNQHRFALYIVANITLTVILALAAKHLDGKILDALRCRRQSLVA